MLLLGFLHRIWWQLSFGDRKRSLPQMWKKTWKLSASLRILGRIWDNLSKIYDKLKAICSGIRFYFGPIPVLWLMLITGAWNFANNGGSFFLHRELEFLGLRWRLHIILQFTLLAKSFWKNTISQDLVTSSVLIRVPTDQRNQGIQGKFWRLFPVREIREKQGIFSKNQGKKFQIRKLFFQTIFKPFKPEENVFKDC